MKIVYPPECKTTYEKTGVLYRAQELLRLEHNAKGKEYREGKITKTK